MLLKRAGIFEGQANSQPKDEIVESTIVFSSQNVEQEPLNQSDLFSEECKSTDVTLY